MKFTLGWLKDHLETTATASEIVEKLTALGMEVESFTDRGAVYAPFAAARIERAEKHPDADRLKVCTIDTGREKLQVVCGAPNARAGLVGVFAPVGSLIPGTDAVLKKGVIRGVESNGMMVSEREMALSDESEGIIELPADTPLGTPMAALYGLDDPVIDIAVTPNRGDWAGVRGIARELAAAGLGTLKPLDISPVPGVFPSPVPVRIEAPDSCPLFVGRLVRGVTNVPSPEWLQRRLKAVGQRPISALVDVTNYLSIALCRPLHVYDAAKLRGGIVARSARTGESFAALDGSTYALEPGMCAICDESGVLGLGGIIGG
ncbi:MAG TPA: phenylalanine--tRNA ligase subunit beta, partial [Alphaproteobacteria bacterium]|nr:phenylalanine--tRNA ligase subunit beta [Alphaproteobacteria bacterium]